MKPTAYVPLPRRPTLPAIVLGMIVRLSSTLVDLLTRHRDFTTYLLAGIITGLLLSCVPLIGSLLTPVSILIGTLVGLSKETNR